MRAICSKYGFVKCHGQRHSQDGGRDLLVLTQILLLRQCTEPPRVGGNQRLSCGFPHLSSSGQKMISAQVEQLYESSSGGGQSVSHIQQDESSFAPDHSPGARLHEHVNTKIERAVTAERQPNSQPGLPKLCVSNSLKATTRFDRDYEKLKISAEKACTRKSLFWLELESLMAKMFGHAEKIALNNHFLYHTSRDKLLSSVVAQGSWESQLATRSHWMECGIRESDPVKEYLVRRCVSGYRSRDITDTALLMVDFKGIPQGSHDWGDILRSYMVIVQRETDIDVMNISIIEVPTDDAWHDTEPAIQSLKTNFIHPKSGNRVSMRDTFSYCSFLHHQDEYDVLVITFLPDSVTATIYQPFGGRDSKRGFIQQSIMGFISSQVRREKCRSPEVNMVFTTVRTVVHLGCNTTRTLTCHVRLQVSRNAKLCPYSKRHFIRSDGLSIPRYMGEDSFRGKSETRSWITISHPHL